MASNINVAIPALGTPTTAGVRGNFSAAKSEIEAIQNSQGYCDYNDTATTTTPISLTSGVWTKLTNNKLGAQTRSVLPTGVTNLWNTSTNQMALSELPLDSIVDVRMNVTITTTSVNQLVDGSIYFAIGSGTPYTLPVLTSSYYKDVGTYMIPMDVWFYIGNTNTKTFPAEIRVKSSSAATVIVSGFAFKVRTPVGV